MKAKVLDLDGRKYYGTYVEIFDDRGDSVGSVVIWLNPLETPDYRASERELASYEYPEDFEICDNHYECELALRVARLLVTAVNEGKDNVTL